MSRAVDTRQVVRSCSTGDVHETLAAGRLAVRAPRDYREVVRGATPPPVVHNLIERAPTPEPDVYERVVVRPQPQHVINRIIERPLTPPPIVLHKEVTELAPPPVFTTRVVDVCPSRRAYVLPSSTRYVRNSYYAYPTDLSALGYARSYTSHFYDF